MVRLWRKGHFYFLESNLAILIKVKNLISFYIKIALERIYSKGKSPKSV